MWIVAHRADAGAEGLREREEQADKYGIVADTPCVGCVPRRATSNGPVQNAEIGTNLHVPAERPLREQSASDTDSARLQTVSVPHGIDSEERGKPTGCALQSAGHARRTLPATTWENFPTQSPVCGRYDGIPAELDGISFPAWRRQSIKAYGNAIVPQVFIQIARTINEYENYEIQNPVLRPRRGCGRAKKIVDLVTGYWL